jgi:alkyl sulfatase BDS1-like metallo-beta-lactamase superfamily hydrolase
VSARGPTSERLRGVAGKLVSGRSDDQLARIERGPQRRVVLETIFAAMRRRFDAEAAGDLDAVAAFCVEPGAHGAGERYEVAIRDGSCTVARGAGQPAQVTFTLGAADLLRLATGAARWTDLLGARRIALAGDPFLALRVIGAFGLGGGPSAA